jgi:hypothetical protein
MIPTHCTELCDVGSGNLWHLPHEFSKMVFPCAICSGVEVGADGVAVATGAFVVQETTKRVANEAIAMIFFIFITFE